MTALDEDIRKCRTVLAEYAMVTAAQRSKKRELEALDSVYEHINSKVSSLAAGKRDLCTSGVSDENTIAVGDNASLEPFFKSAKTNNLPVVENIPGRSSEVAANADRHGVAAILTTLSAPMQMV